MKANKQMEDIHRTIVKKWHTLASLCGLTEDDKKAVLASYGVQSSNDMQTHDLIDVCGSLQKQLDAKTGASAQEETKDKLRKRALRCMCDYIDAKGIKTTDKIAYAKQMATRAAKKTDFNRLTTSELRGVIGYFNKERETLQNAKNANTITGVAMNINKPIAEA